jgi:hypothetical protein
MSAIAKPDSRVPARARAWPTCSGCRVTMCALWTSPAVATRVSVLRAFLSRQCRTVALPATIADELARTSVSPASRGSGMPRRRPPASGAQARDRARTIERIVSRATTATIWAPSTTRLTSTAGRQLTSSPRIRNIPTGRALRPKPPPEPFPSPAGPSPPPPAGTASDGCHRDRGHAVLLVRLTENPLHGERVPRLRDDLVSVHCMPLSPVPSVLGIASGHQVSARCSGGRT